MHANCVILCFTAEDFDPLGITSEETKVCPFLFAVLHKALGAWGIQAILKLTPAQSQKGNLKRKNFSQ